MPDMNEGKPWTEQDDFDLRIEVSTGETIEHAATRSCADRPKKSSSAPLSAGCAGTVPDTSNCRTQIRDGCHVSV
jgi:hypothetical protein